MKNKKTKTFVVLSGGLDSCVCLAWAKTLFDEVNAITFDYGQKNRREIQAAKDVCNKLGVASHEIIHIEGIFGGHSPLTDHNVKLKEYEHWKDVPSTGREHVYVPGRNAIFITIAASRAYAMECNDLVVGIFEEAGQCYPDVRRKFADAMRVLLPQTFDHQFTLHTPLMDMQKYQIVQFAKRLKGCWEALAFTHSSYDNEYPPNPKDRASQLRAKAFLLAGFPDPMIMKAWKDRRLKKLPETENYKE